MAINFKKVAEESVSSSPIMTGRKGMKNDDVIMGYPNGVTIIGFDIIPVLKDDGSEGEMPVFIFAENDKVYGKGGSAHTKIFKAWLSEAGDDATCESVSADLKAFGGVKMKAHKIPLKNGRIYTEIDIL